MLEQLLKLYTMYMATGVTSPMPHFVGPPGSGKSTVFEQLADIVGVDLHVVNVSRINPLGLEGLEMPDAKNSSLQLLISELWTKGKEGDIYLFDEFLRGFPEVYNGLLDIFTARQVAGFQLPKVFIAGASNSTATYDPALEDRLLHLPVPDPRSNTRERMRLAQLLVDQLGLVPEMVSSFEMDELMQKEVLPTYEMLDSYKGKGRAVSSASMTGSSIRKLIGQAKLRQVVSRPLKSLISVNNAFAAEPGKAQYMFLLNGKTPTATYEATALQLKDSDQLTPLQRENLELNLQLIELEHAKHTPQGDDDDGPFDLDE